VVLVLVGIFGFVMLWADILPAFGLLNEITLWSHAALVSGEQQLIPVTLMDLGQACMIAFITVASAKYLPSLLEIIMLQQTSITAGSRYTVTTVTNYIIVATGVLSFFNILGVDWSKLQWLVAALGVGIGFGLQEIVANFISGIIILFERPIRIGDTVTIGENDGVVVRIRIRATTIRNWDRKELLVPNKEFITGQLINWTLSEPTTRIVIPVGLAYGGDVELALKLMMEAAEEHSDILLDPAPTVVFDEFGDNALSLKLRCFIPDTFYRLAIVTCLHKAINQKFNDAGLVIAFPQRDVHLNTNSPLDIRIQQDSNKLA
jgi:potassium efflux system protein